MRRLFMLVILGMSICMLVRYLNRPSLTDEEYHLYSDVFNQFTRIPNLDPATLVLSGNVGQALPKDSLKRTYGDQLVEQLYRRNQITYKLADRFTTNQEVVFLSGADFAISRVAFNDSHTEALYVSRITCGMYRIVHVVRQSVGWRMESTEEITISRC